MNSYDSLLIIHQGKIMLKPVICEPETGPVPVPEFSPEPVRFRFRFRFLAHISNLHLTMLKLLNIQNASFIIWLRFQNFLKLSFKVF